jgi:acyl dehydratase
MSGPILRVNELHQHVGQTFVSHWFALDKDRIDAFAKVTEDEHFIHVDIKPFITSVENACRDETSATMR